MIGSKHEFIVVIQALCMAENEYHRKKDEAKDKQEKENINQDSVKRPPVRKNRT